MTSPRQCRGGEPLRPVHLSSGWAGARELTGEGGLPLEPRFFQNRPPQPLAVSAMPTQGIPGSGTGHPFPLMEPLGD